MMRANEVEQLTQRLLLLLIASAIGCTTPGTHPAFIVRARPTEAFPVTWDGRTTDGLAGQVAGGVVGVAGSGLPGDTAQRGIAAVQATAPGARLRIAAHQLVAVLELHDKLKGADASDVDAAYFGNQVRAKIKLAAPDAQVMTRENVLVLLRSTGRALADCEGECEVDTGRRLGADLVISGELIRVGSKLKLDLRLHDTHNGQLLAGATAEGKTVDQLDGDLPRAVNALITK